MGVLKRFFKCSDEKCNNEWDSIAYQVSSRQLTGILNVSDGRSAVPKMHKDSSLPQNKAEEKERFFTRNL